MRSADERPETQQFDHRALPFAIALGDRTINGHVHVPAADRATGHAVVLVPGGLGSGSGFDDPDGLLRADDIAALGFLAVHFDPAGRGESSGQEDYWGPRHQEDLRAVLDYVLDGPVQADRAGVLSLSMGITIAAGALAGYRAISRVPWLFDWEGPSNRRVTTLNGSMPMFESMPVSDSAFWEPREARNFIGALPCGYFRYQGMVDHVQGAYKGHAVELLNLATAGRAAWTQCNDNPANMLFDENLIGSYRWVPEEADQNAAIMNYLVGILSR